MAQAKDPLNPPRPAGYDRATPEEIAADIERTRAHMDETLEMLGRRLRPRLPGKAALRALGLLALAGVAALGLFAGLRGYRRRHTLRGRLAHSKGVKGLRGFLSGVAAPAIRKAGTGEQAVLAARLALAARGGKPTIIVVQPRNA